MAQAPEKIKGTGVARPERARPSAEESLRRVEEFEKRKENFVAATGLAHGLRIAREELERL